MVSKFWNFITPNIASPESDPAKEIESHVGTSNSSHLRDYISFYQKLERPGYALLVTGAWGTGKTFQVKNAILEKDRYYVSLFGVQTIEQLHAEVFAAIFPSLNKAGKVFDTIGDTAKGVGGLAAIAGAAPTMFNAIFRRDLKPDRMLIFDDLERSRLPLEDVLGGINTYVEQMGFCVTVIAHDGKLADDFRAMKEKTFGQVIRIKSEVDHAFMSFVERVQDAQARGFIASYKSIILDIFTRSGEESLRILRHLLEDLDRAYHALSEGHLSNENAMRNFVGLFSAFDIEIRCGRLSADDLKGRSGISLAAALRSHTTDCKSDAPALVAANDKYPTVELEDEMLSDELLIEMFIDGRYDYSKIRASLNNSAFFIEPTDVPPWKVVINFDELADDLVEEGCDRMEEQFIKREVTESGEILHIFALRLMMSENGIIPFTIEEEKDECRKYIDDLSKNDRLPPRETDWDWSDGFVRSYDGYSYWVTENTAPAFNELREHLLAARQTAFEKRLPLIAEELLLLMHSDAQAFFEMISPTNNGPNPYANISVLQAIDPERFVNTWIAAPTRNWRYIGYGIENRFAHGRIERDHPDEIAWAQEVHRLLLEKSRDSKGLSGLRIRRSIPKVLRSLVI